MPFSFGSKSVVLLYFFIHLLIFAGLSLVKYLQQQHKANAWLSLLLALAALYISPFMLGYAGWYGLDGYREILFYLPLQQVLLIPPVLYLYTRSLLDRSFQLSKKDGWHFVPALLYLIYSLFIFISDRYQLSATAFYADGRDKDFAAWYQFAGFLSLSIYVMASLRFYRLYRRLTYQISSAADSLQFTWAYHLLIALVFLLLIRLIFFFSNPEWDQFGKKFWYYCCFSILFYVISVNGYMNSIRSITSIRDDQELEPAPDKHPVTAQEAASIPEADLALMEQVNQLIEKECLYENPTLTLQELANVCHVAPKKLSATINLVQQMNFNDYINKYRTEAVIRKMAAGEHNLQTLLGIAYDCGFNSKSTFNRAFKKQTGLTPRDYLQEKQGKTGVRSGSDTSY
jgi:AraC-like DNA-binding protein